MRLLKVIKNPRSYWHVTKMLIAGWYFDVFQKRFKADACIFEIPKHLTNRVGRGYFALDLYEDVERKLIGKYILGNEKVLELGACIGVVSCLLNTRLKDKHRHIVVEANPNLIPFLDKNRALNSCQFKIFNGVISLRREESFYFGNSIVEGTLLKQGEAVKVDVVGKSIADLESEHQFQFDTLVMDIEGGEYNFFMENKSRIGQFNLIILENHPQLLSRVQIEEYESILLDNGFKLDHTESTSTVWAKQK